MRMIKDSQAVVRCNNFCILIPQVIQYFGQAIVWQDRSPVNVELFGTVLYVPCDKKSHSQGASDGVATEKLDGANPARQYSRTRALKLAKIPPLVKGAVAL